RTDVFVAGIMLYEMLTLESLYAKCETFAELLVEINGKIVPEPQRNDASAELRSMVRDALAIDPTARISSATAFRERITRAIPGWSCEETGAFVRMLFSKRIQGEKTLVDQLVRGSSSVTEHGNEATRIIARRMGTQTKTLTLVPRRRLSSPVAMI